MQSMVHVQTAKIQTGQQSCLTIVFSDIIMKLVRRIHFLQRFTGVISVTVRAERRSQPVL